MNLSSLSVIFLFEGIYVQFQTLRDKIATLKYRTSSKCEESRTQVRHTHQDATLLCEYAASRIMCIQLITPFTHTDLWHVTCNIASRHFTHTLPSAYLMYPRAFTHIHKNIYLYHVDPTTVESKIV